MEKQVNPENINFLADLSYGTLAKLYKIMFSEVHEVPRHYVNAYTMYMFIVGSWLQDAGYSLSELRG